MKKKKSHSKKNDLVIRLREKSLILSWVVSFFLILFAVAGTLMASLGICFVCLIPATALFLGLFGLSVGTLLDYNAYFIVLGIISIIISIVLYRRRKCKNGTCKLK